MGIFEWSWLQRFCFDGALFQTPFAVGDVDEEAEVGVFGVNSIEEFEGVALVEADERCVVGVNQGRNALTPSR